MSKLEFMEQFIYAVIASQWSHWRGNPLRKGVKPKENREKTYGDCHVGLRPPRNDILLRLAKLKFNHLSPSKATPIGMTFSLAEKEGFVCILLCKIKVLLGQALAGNARPRCI